MKTKNLKKLILLGLTSLLTANFSVLGMESNSDSEDKNEIKEISIHTKKNLTEEEKEAKIEKAEKIVKEQKNKVESIEKIYGRFYEENREKDTGKFIDNLDKNYDDYKQIVAFRGFYDEAEQESYYDKNKKFHAPLYKYSDIYKKLDEAKDLIKDIIDDIIDYDDYKDEATYLPKDINDCEAVILINEIKNLKEKVYKLIGNNQETFEKHLSYTLKTIYYEAKYCLDYIEEITKVKSSESEFDKKFLKFLDEINKDLIYNSYDYLPNKSKFREKFNKYKESNELKTFVKDLKSRYEKLKEIINKTHTTDEW